MVFLRKVLTSSISFGASNALVSDGEVAFGEVPSFIGRGIKRLGPRFRRKTECSDRISLAEGRFDQLPSLAIELAARQAG